MKTLYAACLSRLGLSLTEAAGIHGGLNVSTVKQWTSGRRTPPPGAWDDLRHHERKIVEGSEALREAWEAADSPAIEIDDSEADGLTLSSAADFVLSTPPGVAVSVGRSSATQLARQARRPN